MHHRLSGTWWPAAAATDRRGGILTFSISTGGRLILGEPSASSTRALAASGAPTADDAVCHGETGSSAGQIPGEPITLLGVTGLEFADPENPENKASAEDLVADVVLRGARVDSADEHCFQEAVAEIPELASWMTPAGSATTHDLDAGPIDPVRIAVPCLTTHARDAHSLHFTVERAAAGPSAAESPGQGPLGPEAQDRPAPLSMRLSAEGPGLSVDEVRQHFHTVQDLITLATLAPPAPLWAQLRTDQDSPDAALFWRQGLAHAGPPAGGGTLVFSSADAPFETLLPRWYALRLQHRVAVDLFMGALRSPHRFAEMNLLVLVASAEALFATTDGRSKRQRKDATLRIKLAAMAERVSLDETITVNLPAQEWADRAARVRNSFTHTGEASGYSAAQLQELVGITAAVVVLNLLRDLGVPSSAWARGLARNPLLRRLAPALD
nr:HEPN domain-containing protein [Nesterenkonia xinjiangensis]